MKNAWIFETDIGEICIAEDGADITDVFLCSSPLPQDMIQTQTPLMARAFSQLEEYLSGVRTAFDLPLSIHGTDFQKKVWAELMTIPYGQTRSYKQIAQQVGNSKACRAVGMANNRNPLLIIVPCHRVVGHNGKLVGYGGGIDLKARLLKLEKNHLN